MDRNQQAKDLADKMATVFTSGVTSIVVRVFVAAMIVVIIMGVVGAVW